MAFTSAASFGCAALAGSPPDGRGSARFAVTAIGGAAVTPTKTRWRRGRWYSASVRLSVDHASSSVPSPSVAAPILVLERPLLLGTATAFDQPPPSKCVR